MCDRTARRKLVQARDGGRAELQGCKAMTETIIMRGAYAITDPRLGASGVILDGAVVIVDGTIMETGPFAAIAPKYPGAGVIGDGTQLLMPGLVDAHSHGRGLSPIQKGVRNDFLENALIDWGDAHPSARADRGYLCAACLGSGCALLHRAAVRRATFFSILPRFYRFRTRRAPPPAWPSG